MTDAPKKRRGPKPKPDSRTVFFAMKLAPTERARLAKAATENGLPPSTLARSLILAGLRKRGF